MKKIIYPSLLLLFVVIAQFYPTFAKNTLNMTTGDGSYGEDRKERDYTGFYANWANSQYLGWAPGNQFITMRALIQEALPSKIGYRVNWIAPVILMFIFSYLYATVHTGFLLIRLLFATSVTLCPMFISFIYVGHLSKVQTLPFFILTVYFLEKYFSDRRFPFLIYGGIALGLAFNAGAIQTAMYFSAVVAAYYFWRLWREHSSWRFSLDALSRIGGEVGRFLVIPAIAFLFAYPSLSGAWKESTKSSIELPSLPEKIKAPYDQTEKKNQKWDWATQWSFPPEELVEFFVPGFFGYKSQDPEAPYWGKGGRSPGWTSQNRIGYANFSYASNYMGLLTVIFALFTLFFIRRHRDISFWWLIAIGSLLLAFGRFFPLFFGLLFNLPFMDRFRNPNKFLHIAMPAFQILSLQGMIYIHALAGKIREGKALGDSHGRQAFGMRVLLIGLFSAGVIGFLALIAYHDPLFKLLAHAYGIHRAKLMVENGYAAFFRFFPLFLASAGILFFILRGKIQSEKGIKAAFLFLLGLCLIDAISMNHQYLTYRKYTNEKREKQEDPMLRFFLERKKEGLYRVKMLNRGNYLYHFRNNAPGVQFIHALVESRPPAYLFEGYYRYLPEISPRIFQLFNIEYLLSSVPLNYPEAEQEFFLRHPQTGEPIFCYRYKAALPRAYIVHRHEVATNEIQALKRLAAKDFDPAATVIHMKEGPYGDFYPDSGAVSNTAKVTIDQYQRHFIHCSVDLAANGCMVFSDLYHPDWMAYVDGREHPIERVNYMMRGLRLEPGKHEIVFRFRPPVTNLILSLGYWLVVLILVVYAVYRFFRQGSERPDLREAI